MENFQLYFSMKEIIYLSSFQKKKIIIIPSNGDVKTTLSKVEKLKKITDIIFRLNSRRQESSKEK